MMFYIKLFLLNLLFILIYISCTKFPDQIINNTYISLTGKVLTEFETTLDSVKIVFTAENDSGIVYSDSVGWFTLNIAPNKEYKIYFFKSEFADSTISINANKDTSIIHTMKKIDYYPNNISAIWIYRYSYCKGVIGGCDYKDYFQLKRKIINIYNENIESEITISGNHIHNYLGTGRSDTTYVDTTYYVIEKVYNHNTYTSFFTFPLLTGNYSFTLEMNKYLYLDYNDNQSTLEFSSPLIYKEFSHSNNRFNGFTCLYGVFDNCGTYPSYYGQIYISNNIGLIHFDGEPGSHSGDFITITLEDYIPAN